jgi:hypothetical protein
VANTASISTSAAIIEKGRSASTDESGPAKKADAILTEGGSEEPSTSKSGFTGEQYVALDCEMVGVSRNGHKSMVAQVAMTGYDGQVLYLTHVKPMEEVTDYRTRWSGVTSADLKKAKVSFQQCQKDVVIHHFHARRDARTPI